MGLEPASRTKHSKPKVPRGDDAEKYLLEGGGKLEFGTECVSRQGGCSRLKHSKPKAPRHDDSEEYAPESGGKLEFGTDCVSRQGGLKPQGRRHGRRGSLSAPPRQLVEYDPALWTDVRVAREFVARQ